ncbi:TIM barrel domain-containing protein (plasmid) [Rhizobium esperanzae]|nr:TIM barrel domain-containing protein [Rhizobium esperanzae]ANL13429.1 TIM-barrel signal transduction protein [Rhizobium sp. N1341]ANM38102.1 TIM barrel domain-containing protein [Rhizobium sp. N871]
MIRAKSGSVPSARPVTDIAGNADSIASFEPTKGARSVRDDIIVLCHGGPIAMPADAAYVLARCKDCNSFYSASSMERLPTEVAIRAQVEDFAKI